MRRWWMLLPVAVVLVLAASAGRAQMFWWPEELHDETVGRQLEPVSVSDRWTDEDGDERERRFEVTLVDVRPATVVDGFSGPEPIEAPSGVAVWEVVLEFEVDPDVPMQGCEVSLFDDQGRESDADGGSVGDTYLPFPACEPENRRGPGYDGTRDEDVLPRLPNYRVAVFALTADDAEPRSVRLWWEAPDYVQLEITRR